MLLIKPVIIEKTFPWFTSLAQRFFTDKFILHHTGGADIDASADIINQWHASQGYSGIGYHFVIRKDGSIERGRPIWAIGAHAYGENTKSIGIQLSGCFNLVQPSDEQIESCAILIADLAQTYHLPINRRTVIGHRDVCATDCPGNLLYGLINVIIQKAKWYADAVEPVKKADFALAPRAGMLSEHFAEAEFECPCCGVVEVDYKLIDLLEQLRADCGGYPLYINSGYRCARHNAEVGGVANSFHMQGKAADVALPRQLTYGQFKWYIERLAFDGVGYYDDFVHLDVRSGGVGKRVFF